LIGSGGMGSVFEAEDLKLGRRCAVKLLREDLAAKPTARRRFEREASLLGRLTHENIVSLLDVGVAADGRAYLVLEYLHGRTLRAELQQAGVRPVGRILEIVSQVARGLCHAHAAGVVHRDLKPENILLTAHADGRLLVKLLDFGIARQGDGSGESITATDTGIGTAAYMAPEQARGDKSLDAATDVYALGAVVYEALAGRRPYDGGSYNETLFLILNRSHKPLVELRPDLSLELCAAVERALEKSSKARFGSVRELAAALGAHERAGAPVSDDTAEFDSGDVTAASDDDGGDPARPTAHVEARWRFVAGSLAGAALGALAVALLLRTPAPEPAATASAPAASVHPASAATAEASAATQQPAVATLAAPAALERPAQAASAVLPEPSARTNRQRAAAPPVPAPSEAAAAGRTVQAPVPGAQALAAGNVSSGSVDVGAAWTAPSGYIADSPYSKSVKRTP
jgi:serine/threonine-protein kinase